MERKKIVLAIASPNLNVYSETFIQAHREIPDVQVKFYYDGLYPKKLENYGLIQSYSLSSRIYRKLRRSVFNSILSLEEEAIFFSFKKQKVDCVLAEFGPTGASLVNVCEKLRLPLIVHFHGYDASVTDLLLKYKEKYSQLFRYAAGVISVSKVMNDKLIEAGCPANKIILNPYGPMVEFSTLKPDYSKPVLIGAGRFVDKKAPYYTILAFKEVVKKFPEAKLVLAGDGPLLNTCKNIVNFLDLNENVEFPGPVEPSQLQKYFSNSRAFVQHSIIADNGDMEGTPVAVLEAGAAGLPVISTKHAGIPEAVIDGETGLLVDEHDVHNMATAMSRLLSDKDLAAKLGQNARYHITENFGLNRHLNVLGEVIKNAVSNNNS